MRKLFFILVLSAVALGVSCRSHAAIDVLWPRNGAVVRETVSIAVDAASVPPNSYLVFRINETFVVSVGIPRKISSGKMAYVWDWDTRDPISLGFNQPAKPPSDGEYDIVITAIGSGKTFDQTTLKVRLSNRVTSIPENRAISLSYKFQPFAKRRYAVKVGVKLQNVGGSPVSVEQEAQSVSFFGVESIEDMLSSTRAVVRYFAESPNLTRFGQPQGRIQGFDQGSLYQLINSRGSVIEEDLFSTVGTNVSPSLGVDFRLVLPERAVKAGDQWTSHIWASMPAIGRQLSSRMTSRLDTLEWASRQECAKIVSTFNADVDLSLLGQDDQSSAPMATSGTANGTCTDWFAFRTGRLVRREMIADITSSMEQSAVQKLMEGLGVQSSTTAAGSADKTGRSMIPGRSMPGDEEMALAEQLAGMYSPTARGATSAGTVQVTLRLHISAKLIN